jgi:serine/threonine protein kinase
MAARCPHDPALTAHLAPNISPSKLQANMNVPRVKASSVNIVPDPHPLHDAASDPPTKVHLQGQTQLFFKAAIEVDSFLRELEILFHIDSIGLTRKFHVPKLQYIVESGDGISIIGMLLNYIEHDGGTLRTALIGSSVHSRKKWMSQIKDIVDQLHSIGVIWGDVKPDNILIDKEGDAWVVDFGGGYSPDWVDHEKRDTVGGDLQGVLRLERFLSIA